MKTERSYKGHLIMLVVNIVFGLNTPITKSLMPEFLTPYSLTFFRFSGACILFWFVSLFVREEKITKKEYLTLFAAGMLGIAANQFIYVQGLSMTTPIDAAIIVTTVPILTMVFAAIYQKEPITATKVTGVFIGAAGAIILILSGMQMARGGNSLTGNLLCVLSSSAYALYLTIFKKLIQKHSPVTLMKWMFLYSTILSIPFCIRDVMSITWQSIPIDGYLRIGYVVVFATFLTYLLIPFGQKMLRPTTLSMYNYVQPLVASVVAIVIGQDHFGWNTLVAAVFVFLGVFIVTQSKSRAQVEREMQTKKVE